MYLCLLLPVANFPDPVPCASQQGNEDIKGVGKGMPKWKNHGHQPDVLLPRPALSSIVVIVYVSADILSTQTYLSTSAPLSPPPPPVYVSSYVSKHTPYIGSRFGVRSHSPDGVNGCLNGC